MTVALQGLTCNSTTLYYKKGKEGDHGHTTSPCRKEWPPPPLPTAKDERVACLLGWDALSS